MVLQYSEVVSSGFGETVVSLGDVLKNIESELQSAKKIAHNSEQLSSHQLYSFEQQKKSILNENASLKKVLKTKDEELMLLKNEINLLKTNVGDHKLVADMKAGNHDLTAQLVDKCNMVKFLYNKVNQFHEITKKHQEAQQRKEKDMKSENRRLKKRIKSFVVEVHNKKKENHQLSSTVEQQKQEIKDYLTQSEELRNQVEVFIAKEKLELNEGELKQLDDAVEDEYIYEDDFEPDDDNYDEVNDDDTHEGVIVNIQPESTSNDVNPDQVETRNDDDKQHEHGDDVEEEGSISSECETEISFTFDNDALLKPIEVISKPSPLALKSLLKVSWINEEKPTRINTKRSVMFNNIVEYQIIDGNSTVSTGDFADVLKACNNDMFVLPRQSILDSPSLNRDEGRIFQHLPKVPFIKKVSDNQPKITAADIFGDTKKFEEFEDDVFDAEFDINNLLD